MSTSPYDALLLVSFGGPEGEDEVVPFLENVTRGRGIPTERLREVGTHYFARGGVSPINSENRALIAALEAELARRGLDLPIAWGNRHWAPYTADALADLARAGHRRVLALTTSAYPSYASCRQYREDLGQALATLERSDTPADGVEIDRVRQYAQTPGFVRANVDAVVDAYAGVAADAALVFVTHSIPMSMAATAGPEPRSARGSYVEWHEAVAQSVADGVSERLGRTVDWTLAYCSRSGPAHQPWLEPDINDHLADLAKDGVGAVVLSPIGFTSDHMEVVHDLDTEAAATARELGLGFARAATARTHPAFVAGLVDLIEERAAAAREERVLPAVVDGGSPGLYVCPATCCPAPQRPGRPAVGSRPDPSPADPGQGQQRSGRVITSES
ncbi:ferrochelatase [Mariniluteicoccus flavus]